MSRKNGLKRDVDYLSNEVSHIRVTRKSKEEKERLQKAVNDAVGDLKHIMTLFCIGFFNNLPDVEERVANVLAKLDILATPPAASQGETYGRGLVFDER